MSLAFPPLQTGFPCVTLAVLELGSVDQAGLEFQRSACLGFPSAGIKGVCPLSRFMCWLLGGLYHISLGMLSPRGAVICFAP
ncbi:mCG147721 [Mus musculus]|nr:mCG147721 [Mus musculus]